MTLQLHTLVVPDDSFVDTTSRRQRNVSAQGTLGSGTGSVTGVSLDPDERSVRGSFRGQFSELMAVEVEELFGAPNIEAVPLSDDGSDERALDGYYVLRDVDRPTDPRPTGAARFDGVVRKVGTRDSHRRTVQTRPATVANDFGSDTTLRVALPSTATDVRWFDPVGGGLETATVQTTAQGELTTFALYDPTEPSFYTFGDDAGYPRLVYDVPYREEGRADCRLWDDYDRPRSQTTTVDGGSVGSASVGTATVGGEVIDGVPTQWAHVYTPSHEFVGTPILDTGRLRLRFDTAAGLTAERALGGFDAYEEIALGPTDWRLRAVDIQRVGLARVEVQARFSDGTSEFAVDIAADRGRDDVLVTRPQNASGAVPSGLQTRLAPVARSTDRDAVVSKAVTARDELRR